MNSRAVILAAGKGVRMRSELPKVLHSLLGKPLILHVIENIRNSGIENITVVVGYQGEKVIEAVGKSVDYVWQKEQLGTGHAVLQAASSFKDYTGTVVVACGDAPLIRSDSFSALIKKRSMSNVGGVVLTMRLDNPKGYGRIVKDTDGKLIAIVEEKDAIEEQRVIKEVNSGTYAFDSNLLFDSLNSIGNNNAQGEYYLPDVIENINNKGFITLTSELENSFEGSGINSPEELEKIEEYLRSCK